MTLPATSSADAPVSGSVAPRQYYRLPPPSPLPLSTELFPAAPPAFAIRLLFGIRRFLRGLMDALTPAEMVLWERTTGVVDTGLIGAIARHEIADLLEERGALDASAIAGARRLDADAVHRTLRALAASGVFRMLEDGRFENNRLSRALCGGRVSRAREWSLYFSSGSNGSAWLDYARTLETGKSAFARMHGMDVWQWFDAHPDEREMFAHCMMGITVMDAPALASIYPFAEVKRLCDVGGGRGTLLSEIVKRHPHIQGVLCDGEAVIESARQLLAERGVADRIELVPGSFFDKVPSGCDTYLLKNILHDWDDSTVRKILNTVRAAMEPGQKLLVCEMLVDAHSRDFISTRIDLHMLVACDQGRERSESELRALLGSAGFRTARVFPFPTVSVVEAVAV